MNILTVFQLATLLHVVFPQQVSYGNERTRYIVGNRLQHIDPDNSEDHNTGQTNPRARRQHVSRTRVVSRGRTTADQNTRTQPHDRSREAYNQRLREQHSERLRQHTERLRQHNERLRTQGRLRIRPGQEARLDFTDRRTGQGQRARVQLVDRTGGQDASRRMPQPSGRQRQEYTNRNRGQSVQYIENVDPDGTVETSFSRNRDRPQHNTRQQYSDRRGPQTYDSDFDIVSTNEVVGSHCIYNNTRYEHGSVTTLSRSPCATFRCEFNTLRLINQECVDGSGGCRPVNERWEESCVTYVCQSKKRNNKQIYQAKIVGLKCTDANGQCRTAGSYFPFRIGSRVYPSCTCNTWMEQQRQKIKYFC